MSTCRTAFFFSPSLINGQLGCKYLKCGKQYVMRSVCLAWENITSQRSIRFCFTFFGGCVCPDVSSREGKQEGGWKYRRDMFNGAIGLLHPISHVAKLSIWLTSPSPEPRTLKMCEIMSRSNAIEMAHKPSAVECGQTCCPNLFQFFSFSFFFFFLFALFSSKCW